MPSFFDKLKSRAEVLYQSGDETDSVKYAKREKNKQPRAGTRSVRSTVHPAACRGLYMAPANQKLIDSRSPKVKQVSSARENDDPNDPIIKHSMYPQMNGKRRSELEAELRTLTMKYDRAWAGENGRERTLRTGRPVRRQHSVCRVRRPRSVKSVYWSSSDSDSDFDYSCSENSQGRPVRVCMYPQARYIKEPVITPLAGNGSSSTIDLHTPSYRNWKRDRLPYDEYQVLRRRQVMQCARDVLEPHYFHRGAKPKQGLVGHGETQCFTEYHTERRRISRIQYAVRKATHADLDPFSNAFSYAMTRHAQNERFCELSDVDGAPIEDQLMWNFIRMYRRARDQAYVPKEPKLAMVRPGELASHTSNDERSGQTRQNTLRRTDSGATMRMPAQRPALRSRMSWYSSDGEGETPERVTDSKR